MLGDDALEPDLLSETEARDEGRLAKGCGTSPPSVFLSPDGSSFMSTVALRDVAALLDTTVSGCPILLVPLCSTVTACAVLETCSSCKSFRPVDL
jgi:hypothetical protein